MRPRTVATIIPACVLLACGPEVIPTSEMDERCALTDPVRILEFESGRELRSATAELYGDRWIVRAGYADHEPGEFDLWSVGTCGEKPLELDAGIDRTWTTPRYDDVVFAIDEDRGEIRAVDPTGAREPKVVFRAVAPASGGTNPREFDAGLVGIWADPDDPTIGELILQPWPQDIWNDSVAPVVLLADVRTSHWTPQDPWDVLAGGEDEAFVRTAANELVRVSVGDGSVDVIARGVEMFELGFNPFEPPQQQERRYLLWQRVALTNDPDADFAEGEVVLLDRRTNEITSLGNAALGRARLGALHWSRSGVLALPFAVGDEWMLRVYSLPSLDYVDVPGAPKPLYALADDRHLVVELDVERSPSDPRPLAILDAQTGALQRIEGLPAHRFSYDQRTLALLPAGYDRDGELWLWQPEDEPRLISEQANWRHTFLGDGRLLTGVGVDEGHVGDLVLIDPDLGREHVIDRDVFMGSYGPLFRLVQDESAVVYSIADGDRREMWLANVPQR